MSSTSARERQQFVVRHDVVDEADPQRLVGVDEVARDRQLGRFAHAHRTWQQCSETPRGDDVQARVRVGEARPLRGHDERAAERELERAGDARAVDRAHHRLGRGAQRRTRVRRRPAPDPEPAATSLKSTPALNTGSTAVTTTARRDSSASASSMSSQKRVRMAAVSAFLTSGRSIVIVRTPSRSSTTSSVSSAVTRRLLRDAEALQAERLDGVAAQELVALLVVETGLRRRSPRRPPWSAGTSSRRAGSRSRSRSGPCR